jgi:carboxyl-terminal processing protease
VFEGIRPQLAGVAGVHLTMNPRNSVVFGNALLTRILSAARAATLLLAVLAVMTFAGRTLAQPISAEEKESILRGAERLIEQRAFAAGVDFKKWPVMLDKYRERIDRAATVPEFTMVVNRALNEFGISHIDLVTPRQAEQINRTSFVGIGIRHRGDGYEQGLRVNEVIEGSPAQAAGLKAGDTIVKVDGQQLTDPSQIRGEEGSVVKLTVLRGEGHENAGKEEDIEVTRATISTREPDTLKELDSKTAVLYIPTFSAGYDPRAVERLITRAKGYENLIIDLRSNGGGAVTNLTHFLGCLLPGGTVVGTSISSRTAERFAQETGKDTTDLNAIVEWGGGRKMTARRGAFKPYEGRVAVLINGGSASASEIFAAAMRELRDAPLVGTPTAGAVLVSSYMRLESGFQMKVPMSDYVTIKGVRLEGNPLEPDVAVRTRRFSRAAEVTEDPVVKAAAERLVAMAQAKPAPEQPMPEDARDGKNMVKPE